MDSRTFKLWCLGVVAFLVIAGPVGYFSLAKYQEGRAAEVEMLREAKETEVKVMQEQKETELAIEKEKTARYDKKYDKLDDMLQRLPFMKQDKK